LRVLGFINITIDVKNLYIRLFSQISKNCRLIKS